MRYNEPSKTYKGPHMPKFSAILFDLDGTLANPKEGITKCIQFALTQLDIQPPEADKLVWCIGPPLRESFSRLLNTIDEKKVEQALLEYRRRYTEIGMYENELYPDIIPILENIQSAEYDIFLATSKPRMYAKKILEHFHISRFFTGIHGSELNGHLTDKQELIAHILDCEKINCKAALMVGDRSHDIVGGKKNGLMTAAVTYGYGSLEEITKAMPDMILNTPKDLETFLLP